MPYGPAGASGRVRVIQWLEQTGIRAEIHDYAGLPNNRPRLVSKHVPSVMAAEVRLRRLARHKCDRVLIQREVSPFSSGKLIERIAKGSSLSVYDFDDALMWSRPSRKDRLWSKSDNCLRAVQAVDRVIAGSETLAEWAQEHNRDVRLIPTCVDPDQYDGKIGYAVNGTPRLVWLGSPSTEVYVKSIAGALLEAHRLTSVRLTVISSGNAPLGPLDAIVDRIEWQPGIEFHLSSYDGAIAPLIDGRWERGKCAYKILQYGAAGLPSVVSPVGANRLAADRLGLVVARQPSEWVDALVDLFGASVSERQSIGNSAREGVRRHYSYARWAREWLEAIGEDPTGS